jgi:cytochrome c553
VVRNRRFAPANFKVQARSRTRLATPSTPARLSVARIASRADIVGHFIGDRRRAFAQVAGAFLVNRARPRVEVEQPSAASVRATGKCAECHTAQQYSVVHELFPNLVLPASIALWTWAPHLEDHPS